MKYIKERKGNGSKISDNKIFSHFYFIGAENDEVPRTARNTSSNGHSFILGTRIYLRKSRSVISRDLL